MHCPMHGAEQTTRYRWWHSRPCMAAGPQHDAASHVSERALLWPCVDFLWVHGRLEYHACRLHAAVHVSLALAPQGSCFSEDTSPDAA